MWRSKSAAPLNFFIRFFMKYQTIYADPPWKYDEFCQIHTGAGRVTKSLPYSSMTIEEIKSLNVASVANKDCRLFMWTTNRYLPIAFEVLGSWGFEYKQTIVWQKTGNPSPWGGSIAPNHAEYLLVAVKGKPKRLSMLKSNVIPHKVGRKHSAKPQEFLQYIETVSPGPYLELFARPITPMFPVREGWYVWGDEVRNDVELEVTNLTTHATDRALPGENAASKAKPVNNPAAPQAKTPGC